MRLKDRPGSGGTEDLATGREDEIYNECIIITNISRLVWFGRPPSPPQMPD